ncbi:MAG: sugar phosphate nucleotidyltransferase [Candidatus Hodarchaeota archaeon]
MNISAFIMAAGKGTRLFPFSKTKPKAMLPLLNKPIIFHSIERLLEAGFTNIGVIIKEEDNIIPSEVQKAFPDLDPFFIVQKEALGTGNAVLQIKEYLTTEHFLVIAGDSLFASSFLKKLYETHLYEKNDVTLSLEKMKFRLMKASSSVDYKNGRVWKIREKPQNESEVLSNLNSAALYVFSKSIFDILKVINKSERGEYELVTAINETIHAQNRVGGVITQRVCHISTPEDLWRFNLQFLLETDIGKINGNMIGENVRINESAKIQNSILGDNSIVIENVSIKNSVILPDTIIDKDYENSLVQSDYFETFRPNELSSSSL